MSANSQKRTSGWANFRAKPYMATVARFVERAIRLYEQEPGETFASTRFGLYVRRWVMWTNAELAVADIPARSG